MQLDIRIVLIRLNEGVYLVNSWAPPEICHTLELANQNVREVALFSKLFV